MITELKVAACSAVQGRELEQLSSAAGGRSGGVLPAWDGAGPSAGRAAGVGRRACPAAEGAAGPGEPELPSASEQNPGSSSLGLPHPQLTQDLAGGRLLWLDGNATAQNGVGSGCLI